MIVQLLLFPFGFFIALFIGAFSGWRIMSALKESENTCIDVSCIFAIVGFIFAFFFTLSVAGWGFWEVLLGLILCGLAGPIIGFAFYCLLSAGYHFRQFRLRMYEKVRKSLK